MLLGIAHSAGLYTYPASPGNTQFTDGSVLIQGMGFPVLKVYCTCDYLINYPLQSSWSSTPTTVKQLAQTTQFTTELAKAWDTVFMTVFTFANGSTNWWRVKPDSASFQAEYTEIRDLAEYLLTTYNGTNKTFILQTWEGDWAFMDSFTVETPVDRQLVDRYAAFLGTRQRAVEDARKAVASSCRVLNAFEANRVTDARLKPHLRRILRDIATRVQPDVISYSAYDSTIVEQGGWGASLAAWTAATTPIFTKALRAIKKAFPGVPIVIGEFGFPDGPEKPVGRNLGDMVQVINDICVAENVKVMIYWQVFDNEYAPVPPYPPSTYRGFWIVKPDGSINEAGNKLISLL